MDRAAIRAEIERLVKIGDLLYRRQIVATVSDDKREQLDEVLAQNPDRDELLKKPDFGREYQAWYSPVLRVVEQLLPDRYSEFRDLYRNEHRKSFVSETFGVADYIAGIYPPNLSRRAGLNVGLNCFERQVDIVATAAARLDSVLTDIGRTLQAEILDNELAAARSLLSASHVRSAGVVAGVVLEGHLKKLVSDHKISFRRTSTLSNLNDALKNSEVYDAPQWRQIQHLTDIRNLCGHRGERDPKRDEVDYLISEVSKIIKNLF